jgi:hypothetical protein
VLPSYGYTGGKHRSAHNVTVGLAAECGILAALAHVTILLTIVVYTLRLALTAREKPLKTFGLGMFGAIVAFAVSGMVMPELYRGTYSGPYFILAGVAFNLYFSEHAARRNAAMGAKKPRSLAATAAGSRAR